MGNRGISLLRDVVLETPHIEVAAVCDAYVDRAEAGAEAVRECLRSARDESGEANGRPRGDELFEEMGVKEASEETRTDEKFEETRVNEVSEEARTSNGKMDVSCETDYRKVIDNPAVEAVIVATAWESHVEIALYAMNAGKAVAIEVGGAYKVQDCWDLVDTYERTRTPFMFLENCCYGRREMMVLNMVQQGLFGEICHCSGGYHHDLRDEIAGGRENRHYRLRNYLTRNAENYPTHELGPIAKVLGINHGNRMVSLVSVASKAAGLHDYIERNRAADDELQNAVFAQGDVVTTIIKCAGGQTITLTLDTTLPRYYCRGFTVRGTRGMYEEVTDSIFLDRPENHKYDFSWRETQNGNAKNYEKEYEHPLWDEFLNSGVRGGHGGMDWLVFQAFFDAVIEKKPMPIDVYDAAAWMAVTALSEQSIAMGGVPVEVPDFTKGRWKRK